MSAIAVIDRRTGTANASRSGAARDGAARDEAAERALLGSTIAADLATLNLLAYRDGDPPRVDIEVRRDYRWFRECDVRVRVMESGQVTPLADVVVQMSKWNTGAFGSCLARTSIPLRRRPSGRVVFEVSDPGGDVLGRSVPTSLASSNAVDGPSYSPVGEGLAEGILDGLEGGTKNALLIAGGLAATALVLALSLR